MMTAGHPDAFMNAVFLVTAVALAGVVHVAWLKSPLSRRFSRPLDAGILWRGQGLLGENKQWRGLMAMPFASAAVFAALGSARGHYPEWLAAGVWELSPAQYAGLGFACGLAFMLAELPNSFFKRRLGVPPGDAPADKGLRFVCLILDRIDSTLGVLLAVTLLLPVSPATWLWALAFGMVAHAAFSVWLHRIGQKLRAF